MNLMPANLRLLVSVLTSVGLLLPATACTSCECCQSGSCSASASTGEKSTCCAKQSTAAATSESCPRGGCCAAKTTERAADCVQEAMPCGLACQCCGHSAPAIPVDSTSLNLDCCDQLFASLAMPSRLPSAGELVSNCSNIGSPPMTTSLRVHALCCVWLN